ncbi:porin [beta proteobacterium MWH-UniP1]
MKKHLIAAAVAAAVAVPAMAQNVTFYGLLDAGYGTIERETAGVKVAKKSAVGFSSNSSSRWGISGTEDLGGGLKASFTVETGISTNMRSGLEKNPQNANGTNNGNGTTLDNAVVGDRGIFATLSFPTGTDVRVGFGSTPIRDFTIAYDAMAGSNMVGNVLNNDSQFSSNRRTGIQVSQTLVKGLKGTVGISKNDDANLGSSNDKSAKAQSGYIAALQYADGPLSIGAAYQDVKQKNEALSIGNYLTAGSSLVASEAVAAFDGKVKTTVIGGSYNFGVAQAFLQYGKKELDNDLEAIAKGEGEADAMSVGLRLPLGAITLMGQYSDGKNKLAAAAGTTESRNVSGYSLGASYAFSKRTSAYLITGETKLDKGTHADAKEDKYSQTALGIVHTF